MGRAILAISGSAILLLPRPFTAIGGIFAVFWRELTRDAVRPYRPELHYICVAPGPPGARSTVSRPSDPLSFRFARPKLARLAGARTQGVSGEWFGLQFWMITRTLR